MAIFILYFALSISVQGIFSSKSCEKLKTCGECITDPELCVWCANDYHNGTRCKSKELFSDSWCPIEFLQNPASESSYFPVNGSFSSDKGKVIQILPQRYDLRLRVGETIDFDFTYKEAQDYPVDLYFLMDASRTMKRVKDETAEQSKVIYETMKNMTKDVYLGLGTFIDKNMLPYAGVTNSTQTYSYNHKLTLTSDYLDFQRMLNDTNFGTNLDKQEGGLDALSQAIVCKEVVGWRKESRKIILFLTNDLYHAAGDGKSAGLFTPYDGKCYTVNNTYTKEKEMDYPSVSMINKLAVENNIIIVFAVDYQVANVYETLSSVITDSESVSYDSTMTDTIYTILRDIYKKITKKVKLNVNTRLGRKKHYEISLSPDCTKEDSGPECGATKDQEKQFKGKIKLLSYGGKPKVKVDIHVGGTGEKLALDIEIIKHCDCEKFIDNNSTFCNEQKRICGVCECGNLRYGDTCACKVNENNRYSDNSTCFSGATSDICSGKGNCFCGSCDCYEGYEGAYCECSKDACPRDLNGVLCSGHGTCNCGKCNCFTEWTGDHCECSKLTDACKGPNNEVCNNRGKCECGGCACDLIAKWDSRKKQDVKCNVLPCPSCHNSQCRVLQSCALCILEEKTNCSCEGITPNVTEFLTDENTNNTDWNICHHIRVDVGCYTSFAYKYEKAVYGIQLLLQRHQNCSENYYIYGGTLVFILLLIGIMTLIAWKCLIEYQDRKEYENFVRQREDDITGPSENPLYEPATTSVTNPAFRKRSINSYR